jgi:hypothetical protein
MTKPVVPPAETVTTLLLSVVEDPVRDAEETRLVMVEPAGIFVPAITMPTLRPEVLETDTLLTALVVVRPDSVTCGV